MRRKPPKRSPVTRTADTEKRRLRTPVPDLYWLSHLANQVSYGPSSKHKLAPVRFGLLPYTGQKEDPTYCDAHASFSPSDMVRIPTLLRRGILAGLIGHNDKHGDPTLIWAVDDNGWIYEGRITIPGRSIYHGYPVLEHEAIGRAVANRYIDYIYSQSLTNLIPSLQ
mgnify:CR=1 FL=1